MADTKELHKDHEGIKVIAHNKRKEGQDDYEYVTYDRGGYNDIKKLPYLTGVETAALILGGIEIRKCYIAGLEVNDFITASKKFEEAASLSN